ncbi:MAG: hypothetical protein ACRD0P_00005, partial [Stackebrandtia sp.]
TLSPEASRWHGLGQGHGRLRYRELDITVTGRRAATRPRHTTLTLGQPGEPTTPPRLRAVE